ncbi:hypothetical protein E3J51_05380 [Candidatus Bathyarchaeota archaeon]|nr:MAG: hypothetical protein E3J51_05380 [Candidatus Bathyarchaeota archaeon]
MMPRSSSRENWIGLLSFGFFIMLFALFFVIVPDYGNKVLDFFKSFQLEEILNNIRILPYPTGSHPEIYQAAMQFCLVFGLFQFFVLALRCYVKSSITKISETISNIVLWLGASYVFNLLLTEGTSWWVNFIGGIIAVLGFSLIARSLIILMFWRRKP